MSHLNRKLRRVLAVRLRDQTVRDSLAVVEKLVSDTTDYDYVKALEGENAAINQRLRGVLPKLSELPERYEAHAAARELRERVKLLEAMRFDLPELPRDLIGVVDLIARVFPDRITFSETARHAAKSAAFQDIHVAWRLLRSMATTLFDLFGTGCDLEREYRNRSGFELALSETNATKKLVEATRQRLVKYQDRYLLADGHVKFGTKPPKLLRVHFTFPTTSPVIIVGHVGDHLATAATRRGKGS